MTTSTGSTQPQFSIGVDSHISVEVEPQTDESSAPPDVDPTPDRQVESSVDTKERVVDPDVYLVGPTHIDPTSDLMAPVDGVAVLTLDDGRDEPHIVFVNDGLSDLTGWRADELLGQPPTKLFARNTGRLEVEAMMRALGLDLPETPQEAAGFTTLEPSGDPNVDRREASDEPVAHILELIDDDAASIVVSSSENGDSTANGHGTTNGTANGTANGSANGHGTANGNGSSNGLGDASVQERAQRMLGSMGEDLFSVGDSLFGDSTLSVLPSLSSMSSLSSMELDLRSTIELDLSEGHVSRSYASVTHMLTRDHKQVPVYFTAHMVASPGQSSSTLVCQVHDLRRATAERLLADKEAVVASLSRGHQLGQLCHQIAVMVEKALGVSATCWVLIANEMGELEPVITGGFDPDIVAAAAAVAQSNAKPVKRVFGSSSLPDALAEPLGEDGVSDLWYVPVMADSAADKVDNHRVGDHSADNAALVANRRTGDTKSGGSLNGTSDDSEIDLPAMELSAVVDLNETGDPADVLSTDDIEVDPNSADPQLDDGSGHTPVAAIMVATGHSSPDRKATVLLEHMAEVLGTAVTHATTEVAEHHQALHDPLTKLPNRALIVDRLGQAMARLDRDGVALSVLLVDIDRFKSINDTYGVEAGDRVLVEVAERLLAAVRLGDTVGRISSDQFLVICVAANGELDTPAVGRRILRAVSEPISISGESGTKRLGVADLGRRTSDEISITASIGAVVIREPERRPTTVIGNAESALSRATSLGRGKFAMFKAEDQNDIIRRQQIEQSLRRAIDFGNGAGSELALYYQPIVEISSGVMVGAEALLRWDRPGKEVCGPDIFMPVAEESDLVMALDKWVINDVCQNMARWPKLAGRWPLVSINLSARILGSETLVPTIREALDRHGLPSIRLGFEITESMQVLDMQTALDNLNRLAALGSRIAIDDFGVGHASLDYLRTFSMATGLKIDRSFVAGLTVSKEDKAIVTASIAMANSLGLDSVAEGVESVEQLLTLREMGCKYAQGFVLARPLPLEIILEIWNRERLYNPKD